MSGIAVRSTALTATAAALIALVLMSTAFAQAEGPPAGMPPDPPPSPPPGAPVSGFGTSLPAPAPPSFYIAVATRNSMAVHFTAPANAVFAYSLAYRVDGSSAPYTYNTVTPVNLSPQVTIHVVTSLQCATTYEFYAYAFGDGVNTVAVWSGVSSEVTGTTDPCLTPTPTPRPTATPVPNRPPSITGPSSVSYAEGRTTSVGSYSASDPDGDSITWSLPNTTFETDRGDFSISSSGVLSFASPPDYENPDDSNSDNVYKITIRASDGSLTASRNVTVTVMNRSPAFTAGPTSVSYAEGSTATAGTYVASDPGGGTITWSLPDTTFETDRNDFSISTGGVLAFVSTPDYENPDDSNGDNVYKVTVRASDGSLAADRNVTITVTNEDPTITSGPTSVSYAENGTGSVGTYVATDPGGGTINWSLPNTTFETDRDDFSITTGGVLTFVSSPDYENPDDSNGDNVYKVTVRASIGSHTDHRNVTVTVTDVNAPPAPTGLRVNGNLVNGDITLRWDPVSGAASYNVRYVNEVCDSDGVCEPDEDSSGNPDWQVLPPVATSGGTVIEENISGLAPNTLYRIEVQAATADASGWSGFAFVYPTNSPVGRETEVATAPFHGYQAKNAQGSHDFRFVLCEETIPLGLTMNAQDMKDAIDEWKDAVIWDSAGANIITTTAYTLPTGEKCTKDPIPQEGRFEVKFASSFRMGAACNPFAVLPIIDAPRGCWRSASWEAIHIAQIASGSILLNADFEAARWNGSKNGCIYLNYMIVHEAGHAFGIGNKKGLNYNRHPINTMHSIMSYDDPTRHCRPQAYDIVAVMALYQSR